MGNRSHRRRGSSPPRSLPASAKSTICCARSWNRCTPRLLNVGMMTRRGPVCPGPSAAKGLPGKCTWRKLPSSCPRVMFVKPASTSSNRSKKQTPVAGSIQIGVSSRSSRNLAYGLPRNSGGRRIEGPRARQVDRGARHEVPLPGSHELQLFNHGLVHRHFGTRRASPPEARVGPSGNIPAATRGRTQARDTSHRRAHHRSYRHHNPASQSTAGTVPTATIAASARHSRLPSRG